MTSRAVQLVVALAVVVAFIGAVGIAGAEMNASAMDANNSENSQTENVADHVNGVAAGHMADHMDGEMIQEHMRNHDHGDHHSGGSNHC